MCALTSFVLQKRRTGKKVAPALHILWLEIATALIEPLQAILWNPFDRALYLSVTTRRPFLNIENFRQPFQGFGQVAVFRIFAQGLYFGLQGTFQEPIKTLCGEESIVLRNSLLGIAAGTINGCLLNPLSALKFQMWNKDHANFVGTVRHMMAEGGWRTFLKGDDLSKSSQIKKQFCE